MTGTFATAGRVAASSIIAFDRYSISVAAVDNAQTRVLLSQERLTNAQEKYGAGSDQARRAQRELEISMRGVEIAQQRLEVRMLMGGLIVFPRMVKGVGDLITQMRGLIAVQDADTISTQINTRAKLANIAVTGLGLGLAIALPALMIVQALESTPLTGGGTSMNFYGDNQFVGVQGPSDFAQRARTATDAASR